MPNQPTNIRDLRESKNLSQKAVRTACGLKYPKYVRIESGAGKTTQAEIDEVMAVLKAMPDGTRKLAGRPFKDAAKQAAVVAARESGSSVAEAIGTKVIAPAKATPAKATPAKKETKPKSDMAAALKKPRAPRKPKAS